MALLPEKYRDAVVVYYFNQQDVVETAETLGLKPGYGQSPFASRAQAAENQADGAGASPSDYGPGIRDMNKLDMDELEMSTLDLSELERILTDEEEIQPMTGFSTRVMRAVREESAAAAPIAFPWARFLPGFVLNLLLLLGAVVWMLLQPSNGTATQPIPLEWLADPQARALMWAALTVTGSGVLAWATTKMVVPRRTTAF